MNITDQDCFKRAVEIAPLEWDDEAGSHFILRQKADGWRLYILRYTGFIDPKGMDGYLLSEHEAHALLEKHFREWLEARHYHVEPWPAGVGYYAEHVQTGKLMRTDNGDIVQADTYLKCLCLAVIECDKKERE